MLEGVAKLPDDRREALIMRFALDMDNKEIARALGRSEGATKVLLHRAIKQLEERLQEDGAMSEVERLLRRRSSRSIRRSGSASGSSAASRVTDAAVDEWADFDESALRDPRRWARPGRRRRDRHAAAGGPGRRARPAEAEEAQGHGLQALEKASARLRTTSRSASRASTGIHAGGSRVETPACRRTFEIWRTRR